MKQGFVVGVILGAVLMLMWRQERVRSGIIFE